MQCLNGTLKLSGRGGEGISATVDAVCGIGDSRQLYGNYLREKAHLRCWYERWYIARSIMFKPELPRTAVLCYEVDCENRSDICCGEPKLEQVTCTTNCRLFLFSTLSKFLKLYCFVQAAKSLIASTTSRWRFGWRNIGFNSAIHISGTRLCVCELWVCETHDTTSNRLCKLQTIIRIIGRLWPRKLESKTVDISRFREHCFPWLQNWSTLTTSCFFITIKILLS